VTDGSWRQSRIALLVIALALLTGTPAVLAASRVRNPWTFGGATGLAAAAVAFGAVWQERYKRLLQRRDEQAFKIEDGCLVLADGRLPRVRDITDPVVLGVHRATPVRIHAGGRDSGPAAGEHVPAYVPRDIDHDLRERLAQGGFVLLVGDSTAGKSRAAFEAMAATLPGHLLICPANRDAVAIAVIRAAQTRQCVLWLDDLEGYLGIGGLTAARLARLVTGEGHHRVIVATIRAAEQARLTTDSTGSASDEDAFRQGLRDTRQVLEQACPFRVSRMFSETELERARTRDWDPRVAEALPHSGTYGIAEYLAAGPELLRDWDDARNSSAGPNAVGAALVAAAIDVRRAGHTSPIPRALLDQTHKHYLTDPEHARTPREPIADAWKWATRQRRATTALLLPVGAGHVGVFDYLVDTIQRRTPPDDHVPESVVRAAIDIGDRADVGSLAETAYAQGRYGLAEYAWRQAWQAKASDPRLGPEHPDTLTSRNNTARVLRGLGRLDEAEAEHRAVLQTCLRALGAEHADTLASRNSLANVLRDLGRLDEAEAEQRSVVGTRTRVLDAEHPDTLNSRNSLASVLRGLGRLDEAEAEHRAVLQSRARVLGAEHPDTLVSRNSVAKDLHALGRLEEAEAEHRAVVDSRMRVLGADHPATLASRNDLATVLRDLGRLAEAEAEHRAVL
jgi:tetratricopeptide (TPR) repeat protein